MTAGTTCFWDESWNLRFTIGGTGVEDRGVRRLTLAANLPPARWITDGQPFTNVTMDSPDGTRWYGAVTCYELSSVEVAGLAERAVMVTVTCAPSRVMVVGDQVQNVAPASVPFDELILQGKGLT